MYSRRLLGLVIAGATVAYLLSLPLAIGRADESHLLMDARRVFDGQAPYRDFHEILTPLSFYVFAAVFAVAGTTLQAARVAIAVIAAIGAVLLWHLARRTAGAPEAVLVTLLFVAIGVPTWWYASPHWMTTTLGLAVAAVVVSERWQGAGRMRPLLAGMLAGAAICNQQQRGAFLALWLPLGLLVLSGALPRPGRWRRLATALVWAAAGGALVIVGVLGHAVWRASVAEVVEMVFGFAFQHYGPAQSGRNGWAAVLPFTGDWAASTWVWLLRASPLLMAGEAILLLRNARRQWQRVDLERAALCLLALLMAASVSYLPDFIHVSFVLPFLLLPGAALLHRLRTVKWWNDRPAGRVVAAAGVLLLAVPVAVKAYTNVVAAHAAAPVRFDTAFGPIDGPPLLQQLHALARQHLVAEPDGRRLFYSYPNDAWLYLTLGVDNATPFNVLVPDMYPPENFAMVAEILRARRPGAVVFLDLALSLSGGKEVQQALHAGYDRVGGVSPYSVYVRRADPVVPPAAP